MVTATQQLKIGGTLILSYCGKYILKTTPILMRFLKTFHGGQFLDLIFLAQGFYKPHDFPGMLGNENMNKYHQHKSGKQQIVWRC